MKTEFYTSEQLVEQLKSRQGSMNLKEYAAEIGISFQFLSDVLRGNRSVGNEKILEFLAPNKKLRYSHRDVYVLEKI